MYIGTYVCSFFVCMYVLMSDIEHMKFECNYIF